MKIEIKKPDKKSIFYLTIIIIFALAISFGVLFYTRFVLKSFPAFQFSSGLEAKKAEILKRVSDPNPLTASEKNEIFKELAGPRIKQYKFTDEEVRKILKALNK